MTEAPRERLVEEAELWERCLMWSGVAAFGVPLALFIWDIYTWLRYGQWQSITVSEGLAYANVYLPYTEWAGIQRIIDGISGMPFGFLILLVGFGFMSIFYQLGRTTDLRISKLNG